MLYTQLLISFALASAASKPSSQFDPCSYAPEDVFVRDLAVIGGGASGTYGAIGLKDQGRSVVVVEKAPEFGGHVDTYNDPKTGQALEYGVEGYSNDSITRAWFARFKVPLMALPTGKTIYADFSTGKKVKGASRAGNTTTYTNQVTKYYPNPALGLHLPTPVPPDLLLPFKDYIKKFKLGDIAYEIWSFTSPANNLLDQLTLYAFFGFNTYSSALLGGMGADVTANNNSELFGKAQMELGKNALVNSHVVAAKRSSNGVSLVVQTPGKKKLIKASQVLFSGPLVLENIKDFDLDKQEHDVFSQFYYTAWYTTLVTDTGLKPGVFYQNAAPHKPYHIPLEPYTFRIGPSKVNDTFYAFYGAMEKMTKEAVQDKVAADIQTLSGKKKRPKFLAFSSHTPFKQQVSADAVKNGFYDKLNALQGHRSMFYTGNALDVSGSSSLFNFTGHLFPAINAAIDKHPVGKASGMCHS